MVNEIKINFRGLNKKDIEAKIQSFEEALKTTIHEETILELSGALRFYRTLYKYKYKKSYVNNDIRN